MEAQNTKPVGTTLAELIAAASEVAFECSDNDKEAYRIVRLALIEILRHSSRSADHDQEFIGAIPKSRCLN